MSQNSTTGPQRPSDEAALIDLGSRLARERLRRNLTQEVLAVEAGVSRATVRRLEAGHSTQLANLIRILRALGMLANLSLLVPEPEVRPLEQLQRKSKERRRASSPRGVEEDAGDWQWGEDS